MKNQQVIVLITMTLNFHRDEKHVNYTLAIDQGTHASRACLFDEFGQLAFQYTKKISLQRIDNRHIEQDAIEIIHSVKEVIKHVLAEINGSDKVTTCGIAIQRSSVLAWLDSGEAVSPVLSWQDTRGQSQLENLSSSKKNIQRISGLPLSSHYSASKLHYLFKQTQDIQHPEKIRLSPLISFLLFHLIEERPYIIDHTNAQRTQLFCIKKLQWSKQLCNAFNVPIKFLPDCVPVLTQKSQPHGHLTGTRIPVTAIIGDQNAAIFNDGYLQNKTALINIGSGAFILSLQEEYRESKKQLSGIAYSEDNKIHYLREATINGAGNALSWLEQEHNTSKSWKNLPNWLAEIKSPPVFINTIGGLASPWWLSDIKPSFLNTSSSTTAASLTMAEQAVAIIESIAFMIVVNIELIEKEKTLKTLIVSGGLSQLGGLCQRIANLSGKPVKRSVSTEATTRGVAWLATGKTNNWTKQSLDNFKPEYNLKLYERYQIFTKIVSELN